MDDDGRPQHAVCVKVKGDRTGGAAPVAPGAMKPEATAEWVDAEAKPTTIAEFIKTNKQTLRDTEQVQAQIQNDLMAEVRAVVEEQVLIGSGVWPALTGILNTPGVVPIAYDAAALPPDLILAAITELGKGGVNANVIALSWDDWEALESLKTGADNAYVNNPFLGLANTLWGRTFVPGVGIPSGTAIVGDTRIGIQVLWREGIHIALGQESDDMVKNRITILAETAVASAVYVPSAWAIVDLTGTGTESAPTKGGSRKQAD